MRAKSRKLKNNRNEGMGLELSKDDQSRSQKIQIRASLKTIHLILNGQGQVVEFQIVTSAKELNPCHAKK